MDLSTREGRRELGARIKRAVRDTNLSLEDVALRIGCSRALIYQYVAGNSLVQPDRLQLIGREVGRPLAWFFADEDDPVSGSPSPPREPAPTAGASGPGEEGRRIRERLAQLRTLVHAYVEPADWQGVFDTCQQMLPLLEHEDDQARIAEVLLMQGEALIQTQEWGPAKGKLEQSGVVFRALGRTDRALACLQSLGHVNVTLGRTEEALLQFQQVAGGESWTHRWQGTLSLGAAHEVLGDYPQAAAMFIRAQEIVDECDDPALAETARLYIDGNWANLELDWGDYGGASERADRCVLLAQRLGSQDQYIEALLTRGLALLGLQDLHTALTELQRALNVAQLTRDHPRWSLALSCRSLARTFCRQTVDSVADGKEALATALRCGASRAEMLAQRALAAAYLADGNTREARYHIEQATAIAMSLRLPLAQAQFAVLRASLELEAGRPAEAAAAAAAALSAAEALAARPVQHDGYLTLARVALERSDWAEAIRLASQADALASAMGVPASAWRARALIAQAQASSGDMEMARASFMRALGRLAESRDMCLRASGVDALLEDREAGDLWRRWLLFLTAQGRRDEAFAQARDSDWPPLLRWLEEHAPEESNADIQGSSNDGQADNNG